LPAIFSWSSLPLTAIRRNAEAVIEPSGKANCAATSRRNGVVGVTVPGAGRFFTVDHSAPGMKGRCGLLGRQRTCLLSARFRGAPARIFLASRNQPHTIEDESFVIRPAGSLAARMRAGAHSTARVVLLFHINFEHRLMKVMPALQVFLVSVAS